MINVFFSLNFKIEFKNSFSVLRSNELVTSSKIITSGSKYNALAIPILCFCPPESLTPFSPIIVSMPF